MTTVVSVSNLVKSYGSNKVINDVSFEVKKGEIFALLGVNGAGKTTILECIENLRAFDSGHIGINGKLGVQLQSSSLPPFIRAKEVIELHAKWNDVKVNTDLINRLGVNEFLNKKYNELSTGQKRRLHLVLAFIHEPSILILDEPTAGLDVEGRTALHEEIRRWKSEGMTIILASHDMTEVEQLCDRLAILREGQFAFIGKVMEIKTFLKDTKHVQFTFSKELEKVDYEKVQLIEKDGNTYVFSTNDVGEALMEMGQISIQQQIEIVDFHLKKATLEQRFMEIAKEERE